MRAAGGDDLTGTKNQTALRQVVSPRLQGGDQFIKTAAVLVLTGQAPNGNYVVSLVGKLVCTKTLPSMPLYFWVDKKNKISI